MWQNKMIRSCVMMLSLLLWEGMALRAQLPAIAPVMVCTDVDGNENTDKVFAGSAPIKAMFRLQPSNTEGWTAHYEWRFYKEGKMNIPYLVRYEENTEYTFVEAGAHYAVCYATFVQGTDTVAYTEDYWSEGPFCITVYESKLEFPNAFTPNGDGINDIYRAKPGYQSIIAFRAIIFNRWGQKLYEWKDPAGGWDGTYRGKAVKDGTYYCLVKAKGADGRVYDIKKDVNLLRQHIDEVPDVSR